MNKLGAHGLAWHEPVGGADEAVSRINAALSRSQLFQGLGHAASVLASRSSLRRLPRKRELYAQGTPATALFLVASGRVRVSRATADRQLTVAYRGGGELVGENALVGDAEYEDSAVTTESVDAVAIPILAMQQVMQAEADLAERMLRVVMERRAEAERRIEGLLVRTVESRVAAFLTDAGRRHGIPDSRGILIGVKYTHQEIGDYVGSTRETVTLTLGEFRRRGLIDFDHRRVIVIDMDGLSRVGA